MDLHTNGCASMTQLETMLLHVRTLFVSLRAELENPDAPRVSTQSLVQHLRNSVELVERAAQGYAWAFEEMLPAIAQLADSGDISPTAADQILAPAYEYLGAEYTDAAMAYPIAAPAGEPAQND